LQGEKGSSSELPFFASVNPKTLLRFNLCRAGVPLNGGLSIAWLVSTEAVPIVTML
jgi:hypothetical protein